MYITDPCYIDQKTFTEKHNTKTTQLIDFFFNSQYGWEQGEQGQQGSRSRRRKNRIFYPWIDKKITDSLRERVIGVEGWRRGDNQTLFWEGYEMEMKRSKIYRRRH